MRSFCVILFVLLLTSACVTAPPYSNVQPIEEILDDSVFPLYAEYAVEQAEDVFALDEQSKAFVAQATRGLASEDEKIKNLIHHIFARTELDLSYRASANTIASQTFKNASANCLSLSIMTFSMAKEAGFKSHFQIVQIPEYWTRREGYSLLNGHINLRIKQNSSSQVKRLFENTFVVDFDPSTRASFFSTELATEQIVLAMFYNNKAADALLSNDDNVAYAYLREAIHSDESYPGSWVNLGLLYRQNGHYDLALAAYQQAISINPDYNTAWENLGALYQQLGQHSAASDINARVKQRRELNPFYHQMLAEIDRDEGSFDSSIMHYERAIRLNNKQHQFYFGLAAVYFETGDFEQSARFLKLAKRTAGKSRVAELYVDKIHALSTYVSALELRH